MRVAAVVSKGHLGLVEQAKKKPRAGEVLLKVAQVGICGSDIHFYRTHQLALCWGTNSLEKWLSAGRMSRILILAIASAAFRVLGAGLVRPASAAIQ